MTLFLKTKASSTIAWYFISVAFCPRGIFCFGNFEKALVTDDVTLHSKLIDMFEAFDNVCRNSLETSKYIINDTSFNLLELLFDHNEVKE